MRGPALHASRSERPPRPLMSMLSSGPVMASKPVAKTMMSSSYSASRVLMPRGVIRSIGEAFTSTSETLSRLKVSKYSVSMGGRLAAKGWSKFVSFAAVSGSFTTSRILARMNSAAVSFAALSMSRSRKAARNCRPPFSHAASYAARRSSGEASSAERSEMVKGWPLVVECITRRISAWFSLAQCRKSGVSGPLRAGTL